MLQIYMNCISINLPPNKFSYMKNLSLIPIRKEDTLSISALELIKAGDGPVKPVCPDNRCGSNTGLCTQNECDNNEGGCIKNECGVNKIL